jgi:hypothetical protein
VRRSTQAQGCGFGEQAVREEKTCFLWLLSLHGAKKVTRSPQASESFGSQTPKTKAKSLDSGFRRNDEL